MAASVLTVGGGLGGTILYAKWDPKFRTNIEKSVPYSDKLFELMLGPPPPPFVPLPKKPVRVKATEPEYVVCFLDLVLICERFIHGRISDVKVKFDVCVRQRLNHCRYRQCLKRQKTQNSQKQKARLKKSSPSQRLWNPPLLLLERRVQRTHHRPWRVSVFECV